MARAASLSRYRYLDTGAFSCSKVSASDLGFRKLLVVTRKKLIIRHRFTEKMQGGMASQQCLHKEGEGHFEIFRIAVYSCSPLQKNPTCSKMGK